MRIASWSVETARWNGVCFSSMALTPLAFASLALV
jgi:hypothetical protein